MQDTTNEQSRAALILLGMVGSIEPTLIISNISVLVEHGLENHDMKFAHDTCLALAKITQKLSTKASSPDTIPYRLAPDHELFDKLEKLLIECIANKKDDQYIPMAQQAVSVFYNLSDSPDELAGRLCKKLARKMAEQPKNCLLLRRVFFVVGHIAVCQVGFALTTRSIFFTYTTESLINVSFLLFTVELFRLLCLWRTEKT